MTDDQDADYGDRAVREPAEKALSYGDAAVAAGGAGIKAGSKNKKAKAATPSSTGVTNLTVNPSSQLDENAFASHLKQSGLPKGLTRSIAVKGSKIVLPSLLPDRLQKVPWLGDLISISDDWELTTGELQLVLKPGWTSWWGQRVVPDLDAQGSYGYLMTDRENDDRETVQQFTTRCWIVPGSPVSGFNTGLTVPTYDMLQKEISAGAKPRLAVLDSRRGLVVIANRARIYFLVKERSCWTLSQMNFVVDSEKYQPKIGRWIIRNTLLHELAAHAGLLTQGLPAEHTPTIPNSRVEKNIAAVNTLKKNHLTELQNFEKAMGKEITRLKSAQVVP